MRTRVTGGLFQSGDRLGRICATHKGGWSGADQLHANLGVDLAFHIVVSRRSLGRDIRRCAATSVSKRRSVILLLLL